MKNLAFVIWMLGYYAMWLLDDYVTTVLMGKVYSDGVNLGAAFITLGIWIFVGRLLYEGNAKEIRP